MSRDVAPRTISMLDLGTSKYSASIFITAAFAAPSVGAAVVCTRNAPFSSTVISLRRARGITRTLKIRFESFITHNMHMEMKHTLASAGPSIRNRAEIIAQPQYVHRFAHGRPKSGL